MESCSLKGRKKKIRCVSFSPDVCSFVPMGPCACGTGEVILAKDEIEALRLKNIKHQDIITGGKKMKISKSTFARIYETCINKIADAIINGKSIILEK